MNPYRLDFNPLDNIESLKLANSKEVILRGIYLNKNDINDMLTEIEIIFNDLTLDGKLESEVVEELLQYYQNPENRHYLKPQYITWFVEYLLENKRNNEGIKLLELNLELSGTDLDYKAVTELRTHLLIYSKKIDEKL